MLIRLKLDLGSYRRWAGRSLVRQGEVLGLSPHFDDQVVLSPIDGIIERIEFDAEEQAVLISIRRRALRWQEAHA